MCLTALLFVLFMTRFTRPPFRPVPAQVVRKPQLRRSQLQIIPAEQYTLVSIRGKNSMLASLTVLACETAAVSMQVPLALKAPDAQLTKEGTAVAASVAGKSRPCPILVSACEDVRQSGLRAPMCAGAPRLTELERDKTVEVGCFCLVDEEAEQVRERSIDDFGDARVHAERPQEGVTELDGCLCGRRQGDNR